MSEWCNGSTASPRRQTDAVDIQMARSRSIRASLTNVPIKGTVTGPIPAPDCTPGYADRDSLERQHHLSRVPVLADSRAKTLSTSLEKSLRLENGEAQESNSSLPEYRSTLAARDYFPAVARYPSTQPLCGVTESS